MHFTCSQLALCAFPFLHPPQTMILPSKYSPIEAVMTLGKLAGLGQVLPMVVLRGTTSTSLRYPEKNHGNVKRVRNKQA